MPNIIIDTANLKVDSTDTTDIMGDEGLEVSELETVTLLSLQEAITEALEGRDEDEDSDDSDDENDSDETPTYTAVELSAIATHELVRLASDADCDVEPKVRLKAALILAQNAGGLATKQ